jgi:hypothetical protein
VLQERYLEWDRRGARPENFEEFLGLGPWHAPDLAKRLNCSTEEAEAILWVYGYAKGPTGVWLRDEDDAARLLHLIADDLRLTQALNPTENYEAEVKRRIEGLIESGKPLPEPTYDVPDDEYEEEDIETPLEEGLTLPCGCGCGVKMEVFRFYAAGSDGDALIKFRLSDTADHYVIDPLALGAILGELAR